MVRRQRPSYLFWVSSAALAGAGAVLTINLLVHVMSFPNLGPGAFAQGYPLLLLFGAVAILDSAPTKLHLDEAERRHLEQQPAVTES